MAAVHLPSGVGACGMRARAGIPKTSPDPELVTCLRCRDFWMLDGDDMSNWLTAAAGAGPVVLERFRSVLETRLKDHESKVKRAEDHLGVLKHQLGLMRNAAACVPMVVGVMTANAEQAALMVAEGAGVVFEQGGPAPTTEGASRFVSGDEDVGEDS